MDLLGPAAAYLFGKLVPYVLWSGFGIRLLDPGSRNRARRAVVLGVLRLALGFFTGWTIAVFVAFLVPVSNRLGFSLPVFYAALVPVRWLEWSVISGVVRKTMERLPLGAGRADVLWRAGGVVLSCATDALVLFGIGAMGWIPC